MSGGAAALGKRDGYQPDEEQAILERAFLPQDYPSGTSKADWLEVKEHMLLPDDA